MAEDARTARGRTGTRGRRRRGGQTPAAPDRTARPTGDPQAAPPPSVSAAADRTDALRASRPTRPTRPPHTSRPPRTPEATAALERAADGLIELLDRQLALHDELLTHLDETRDAIRRADPERIGRSCAEERRLSREIQSLERSRRDLVARMTRVVAPESREPLTLPDLAAQLPDESARRLLDLRGQLRATLEEAKRRSSIVTQAADAVGRHLAGLVQSLGTALGQSATYGRRGRMDPGPSASMRLDLRT